MCANTAAHFFHTLHTHTHTHTHTYTHTHTHVYIYIYIHIHTHCITYIIIHTQRDGLDRQASIAILHGILEEEHDSRNSFKTAYCREMWEKIYFGLSDIMNTVQTARSKKHLENSPTAISSFIRPVTSTALHMQQM
jgi:hypothetical protein